MIVAVPAATAVTTPVDASIAATEELLENHSPLPVAEDNVADPPAQIRVAPTIGAAIVDTVTSLVT